MIIMDNLGDKKMDSLGFGLCVGYVVNVHDPLNYDLDLLVRVPTDDGKTVLNDAILSYADYRCYTFGRSMTDTRITERKAYRCRLRGVVRKPELRAKPYRTFRPPSFMAKPQGQGRSLDRRAWIMIS